VLFRGAPLVVLVFGGLLVHISIRLFERPLFGLNRPVTPWITQFVCRNALRILGIGFRFDGDIVPGHDALVANHSSWLDIYALNACTRLYFVSKSEVATWPGIGWLARANGTVFIDRDPKQVRAQTEMFKTRLRAGHRLLFFPEGTSTDGRRVLAFRPTLFAAFFDEDLKRALNIQALSVVYHAPQSAPDRFYGWWGNMDFGSHLLKILAAPRQGSVHIRAHPPRRIADFSDRKALARDLEAITRRGLEQDLAAAPLRPNGQPKNSDCFF